jgi:hypothetical protein
MPEYSPTNSSWRLRGTAALKSGGAIHAVDRLRSRITVVVK